MPLTKDDQWPSFLEERVTSLRRPGSIDSYSAFRYHDKVVWEVVRMLLKKAIQHL